jgi:peptidoglycan hydrolase-like protein with peptidoglycan-binding domain
MKRVPRHAPWWLTGLAVVAVLTPVSYAAAAQTHPRSTGRTAELALSRVSLSLAATVVTPGELTTIRAQVKPRAAGRVVFLRKRSHGHFVNLKFAFTNARGIAQFKYTFRATGNVLLRASVVATDTFLQATSSTAIEAVDTQLPYVLPTGTTLGPGASGPLVLQLQQHLNALGYWIGSPDGHFGDATQQAAYALEKVAGIARTGVVNAAFVAAMNAGALPHPRTTAGNAIDVDLSKDLLMIVQNGVLKYVLNTSTGGGYSYTQDGATYVAITPPGVYAIGRTVDGTVVDSLGTLWRPRFFYEGFAIHGDSYVPPTPVSHGCVRVSNEAIDWIWAQNLAPIGMKVWVY